MSKEWDGKERRNNDSRIRDLEEKDRAKDLVLVNLRDSVSAVHKRFTQFDHEQKAEIRISTEDIKNTFKEYADKQEGKCKDCKKEWSDRITILEHWRTALASAYSAGCVLIGAWIGLKK